MKIWLNDLKEGDVFYHIIFHGVYKCRHLGDAHNMNFRMSSIKFEIIDEKNTLLNEIFSGEHEAFVNQYVYSDYESAVEALKEKLQEDFDYTIKAIVRCKNELDSLTQEAERLKNLMKKYGK